MKFAFLATKFGWLHFLSPKTAFISHDGISWVQSFDKKNFTFISMAEFVSLKSKKKRKSFIFKCVKVWNISERREDASRNFLQLAAFFLLLSIENIDRKKTFQWKFSDDDGERFLFQKAIRFIAEKFMQSLWKRREKKKSSFSECVCAYVFRNMCQTDEPKRKRQKRRRRRRRSNSYN